jgi:hypothetical protein
VTARGHQEGLKLIEVLLNTALTDALLDNEHLEAGLRCALQEDSGLSKNARIGSGDVGTWKLEKSTGSGKAVLQQRREVILNLIESRKKQRC